MKRLFFVICSLLVVLFFSCNIGHKAKSQNLLKQAKEDELLALYDEMIDYLSEDENYQFVEEQKSYYLKNESIAYVLRTLFNFHKENHLPILQDEEHPENWDNWFYFTQLFLSDSENGSYEKLEEYQKLFTTCDFCYIAYKDNKDITWPSISYSLINDFPELHDAASSTINRLNIAKQKADEEEAERKRIEAARLKGIWDCEFGMSKAEVEKKLKKKFQSSKVVAVTNSEFSLNPEPDFADLLLINNVNYGDIDFNYAFLLFLNDEFYKVYLLYDGQMSAYFDLYLGGNTNKDKINKIKFLIKSIVAKYDFKNPPVDASITYDGKTSYGKTYKKSDNTEVFYGIEDFYALISLEDVKIKNKNYDAAQQKYYDSVKNQNNF